MTTVFKVIHESTSTFKMSKQYCCLENKVQCNLMRLDDSKQIEKLELICLHQYIIKER